MGTEIITERKEEPMSSKIRADLIFRQLAKRHQGRTPDLFLAEVKNGPTWTSNNLLRLDAIAIKRSWKQPCITGYEIKVHRQDFLRDDKWPSYLQYCHRFYFACPTGLIQPEELPVEVGMIYYNADKDCIHTKRAAPFRVIEIDWQMLYYILICRQESDHHPFFSSQREYLEAWVQDKEVKASLSRMVSGKTSNIINGLQRQIRTLERKVDYAELNGKRYEQVKATMRELGINCEQYNWQQKLRTMIQSGLSGEVAAALEHLERDVKHIKSMVSGEGAGH